MVKIFHLLSVKSYLSQRKQRMKVNNTFSNWTDILYEVPQRSILVSLLFNVFLCDLSLAATDIDIQWNLPKADIL